MTNSLRINDYVHVGEIAASITRAVSRADERLRELSSLNNNPVVASRLFNPLSQLLPTIPPIIEGIKQRAAAGKDSGEEVGRITVISKDIADIATQFGTLSILEHDTESEKARRALMRLEIEEINDQLWYEKPADSSGGGRRGPL
jgi:hypothetical protein